MNEKINVNVLLCKKYETENDSQNISNIFNKVKLDSNHRTSFTIVTMVSEREDDGRSSGTVALHYFITKDKRQKEKKMWLYVGATKIEFCDETDENAGTDLIRSVRLKNVPFIEDGKYTIEVYLSEDIVNGDFEELKSKSEKIIQTGKLMTKYSFEVIF